jgi:hypothetical protein
MLAAKMFPNIVAVMQKREHEAYRSEQEEMESHHSYRLMTRYNLGILCEPNSLEKCEVLLRLIRTRAHPCAHDDRRRQKSAASRE